MTDKIEHIKLVQNIIARLAGNSAQSKTWAVSLAAATIMFSGLADSPHWLIAAGGGAAVVALWVLDARYLHLERCYVKLHEAIVAERSVASFDLNYSPYVKEVGSVWKVACSWSVGVFYGVLLAVMVFVGWLTANMLV